MGVCGLWCFIVGYARLRNDLGELHMLVPVLFSNIFHHDGSLCCVHVARRIAGGRIPDGIAVLAGLAVQETQLLEGLAENVFAAHFVLERCARDVFRRARKT